MPINLYVAAPTGSETAHWFLVTDHEGLSFTGAFPWAARAIPPDQIRYEQREIAFGDPAPHWRPATRDEAVCLLWDNFNDA